METLDDQLEEHKRKLDNEPEDFDANYQLGNIYYSNGEDNYKNIGNVSEEEGKSLISLGNTMMEYSMPYFEKALELKPQEEAVASKLKIVYGKLKLDHKIKGINERIKD